MILIVLLLELYLVHSMGSNLKSEFSPLYPGTRKCPLFDRLKSSSFYYSQS